MKKAIRLLVEDLFDDIYAIEDEKNIDTEFAEEHLNYNIGDIYYQNKKPYAICCGNKEDFKDNKPRFMFSKIYIGNYLKWSNIETTIPKLKIFNDADPFLLNKSSIKHIDKNGYKNTQIIKNNYDINNFPAFNYCCNLGDDIYLPAIDELQILFLNLNSVDYN